MTQTPPPDLPDPSAVSPAVLPGTKTAPPVAGPSPVPAGFASPPVCTGQATLRELPIIHIEPTPVEAATAEGDREPEEVADAPYLIKAAPPWLISLIFHTAVLIVLAILFFGSSSDRPMELEATYADSLGDQLDDESFELAGLEELNTEQVITPEDLPPVDDPLAAPPDLEPLSYEGNRSVSDMDIPEVGLALTGREPGMKKALLAAYGGDRTTEEAVRLGLGWLQRNQQKDGLWSLTGPYNDGAPLENKVAATAMALLAFQGAGHTDARGDYRQTVGRGWNALLAQQDRSGNFVRHPISNQSLYAQAQATIAVCEMLGMTDDSKYREPAERALGYVLKIQSPEGGWRYYPGDDTDTSVTGWFVMALQSARMAGLEVPSPTLLRISQYLDRVATDGGSQYRYRPNSHASPAMTAEGLLCRQYLGWKQDDPRLVKGIELLNSRPIRWDDQNVYYWYYATQAAHHMEGDAWDRWNRVMRRVIPKNQVKTGAERGSWPPHKDDWGPRGGGRLYTTCLPIYMLEVYYRHLPIYQQVYKYNLQF